MYTSVRAFRRSLPMVKGSRIKYIFFIVCVLVCLHLWLLILSHKSHGEAAFSSVSAAPTPPSSSAPQPTGQATSEAVVNTSAAADPLTGASTFTSNGPSAKRTPTDTQDFSSVRAVEIPTNASHAVDDPHHLGEQERIVDTLRNRYGGDIAKVDALDVFPLRPHERQISFAEFARCLAERLSVNPDQGTELSRDDLTSNRYAPFLISVTMENTQDLKALICNLTMPFRFIVLAQNGDTPEVTPFFDLLRRVFGFTKRLTVFQFHDNIGFAGAVNAGLREALSHPFSEVPFVHITHNDVRFLSSSLEQLVARAYNTTAKDIGMIDSLKKEVAMEPNEHTPLIWLPGTLRGPLLPGTSLPQKHNQGPIVVTSALLPDRIRYMTPSKRAELMRGHTSVMFSSKAGAYTSVFVSRLALLTVGFFDENFFPTLFDDTDYRWRAHLLGFDEDLDAAMGGQVISYDVDCVTKSYTEEEGHNSTEGALPSGNKASGPTLSPAGMALQRECRKAFNAGIQYTYMKQKWGVESVSELMSPHTQREPFSDESFSGRRRLPLDAWVVDTDRLTRLRKWLLDSGHLFFDEGGYDTNVIVRAFST